MDISEETKENSDQPNIIIVSVIVFLVIILIEVFGFWVYGVYQAKNIRQRNQASSNSEQSVSPVQSVTTIPSSQYIFPDSDKNIISQEELKTLSEWQLKVARNEIYARHGRPFEHQDLQCYFEKTAWYQVNPEYSDQTLSSIETTNIDTILEYEKEINSSYLNYDSGCSNL